MNGEGCKVMAIVNLTPDSFYAQSRVEEEVALRERIAQVVAEGASMIDLGGCSTRPGATPISVEEEWRRVERGLSVVSVVAPQIALSVDTFRAEVARRVLECRGDVMINDISGGSEEMMEVVAHYGADYVLTHSVGGEAGASVEGDQPDIAKRVEEYFERRLAWCAERGVGRVWIDPGIGFAGGVENDFRLLAALPNLRRFGCPLLVGLSRKRLVWSTLGISPDEALVGSVALHWEALRGGADMLRVHDVRAAKECVTLYDKYCQTNR